MSVLALLQCAYPPSIQGWSRKGWGAAKTVVFSKTGSRVVEQVQKLQRDKNCNETGIFPRKNREQKNTEERGKRVVVN